MALKNFGCPIQKSASKNLPKIQVPKKDAKLKKSQVVVTQLTKHPSSQRSPHPLEAGTHPNPFGTPQPSRSPNANLQCLHGSPAPHGGLMDFLKQNSEQFNSFQQMCTKQNLKTLSWPEKNVQKLWFFRQNEFSGVMTPFQHRVRSTWSGQPHSRNLRIARKFCLANTLQGINISHLGKWKIIFNMPIWGDMLVPWRVYTPNICYTYLFRIQQFSCTIAILLRQTGLFTPAHLYKRDLSLQLIMIVFFSVLVSMGFIFYVMFNQ